jgi:acetyl-CoA carboxylase biotin carboxyl carrier protein
MKPQDMDDLKQLIEFLKSQQVTEFDLDRGDVKIRLKFSQNVASSSELGELEHLLSTASPIVERAATAATHAAVPTPVAVAAQMEAGLHIVKSPMVGTFFNSPAPDAAPFVSPGDRVAQGQVIGIVEAMKLMNEIESDAAGEVVECLVINGQPIEYGQPLYSLRIL